jgi:5-methyltetrahydrofolate--homocysteine methyltransferase
VKAIHDELSVPLVLRSDDPIALEAGLQATTERALIDATLPGVADLAPYIDLAKCYGARLAVSACPGGLPTPTEERLAVTSETLLPRLLDAGLSQADVYIDPLVASLSCDQPMIPATVETVRLLKVAADPAPNTLIHLEDVADGTTDLARRYIVQAYATMLQAAGVDILVANPLDPELMEALRVVRERDAVTAYDRLLLRLYDVTRAEVDLDSASVDRSDLDQISLFKTVQVLTNQVIYADSYLST